MCRLPLEMLIRPEISFYPVFPVPKEVQEDVNLSITHSSLLRMDGSTPDIVVLPSRLKEFQKVSVMFRQLCID